MRTEGLLEGQIIQKARNTKARKTPDTDIVVEENSARKKGRKIMHIKWAETCYQIHQGVSSPQR